MALFPPVYLEDFSGVTEEDSVAMDAYEAKQAPKHYFLFQNVSDADMYIDFDREATTSKGIKVAAGLAFEPPPGVVFVGRLSVMSETAGKRWICKVG